MKEFREQKESCVELIATLKADLELERKNRIRQVSEKEREKLLETEKLRREMLKQIKMTKASLLSMNDEQQHITTRLTMQQNVQLTSELEFQSKETEKLLAQN